MAHPGSPEKKAIKRVCVCVHWYFYAKFNFCAGGVSLLLTELTTTTTTTPV